MSSIVGHAGAGRNQRERAMTIRNLEHVFRPASVAVIGASNRPGSLGAVLMRNMLEGGLAGAVMPVNPKHAQVQSVAAYPDISSLPATPDLGVIATPPETVPGLIAELGARGTKAAIVITAGIDGALRQKMLDAARPHLLRIVGPNCLGVMVPPAGLNAGFGHLAPAPGHIAFVAQSGAMVTSIVDWAAEREIGFSHLVSLGDMSDIDFGDMLDYLANDKDTHAILLYVEAVTQARKFMSAARAAARSKPVIVVKSGRFAESARAAASHTGALAGSDAVYDAAFRRAGMLRVYELEELFDAVETLGKAGMPKGDRLTIMTNGGGLGVMATDTLIECGGRLSVLPPAAKARLDAVLPATWSKDNPVDIIGDAPGSRYAEALRILLEDGDQDALLILNSPTAIVSGLEGARAVIDTLAGRKSPTVLTSWVGGRSAREASDLFSDNGIPSYPTPSHAVRAFMHLVTYQRNQTSLIETPPSIPEDFTPDLETARGLVDRVLAEGREWMTALESKALLRCYDIPAAETLEAKTAREAADAAARIGGPVALKILSPDITHKTEVGGVVLDIEGAAVEEAAEAMAERVRGARPDARIDGFMVEAMIDRPGAFELIAGMTTDRQFGPVLLFGQGGTAVEVAHDTALALPPLNMRLARDLMERTRIYGQLRGYRGLAPADLDGTALTLIKIAQMAVDFAEVQEIDINPLLVDASGVLALDARVRLASAKGRGAERLAIRPYPKELEEAISIEGLPPLLMRPVVPEDEPSLQAAFAKLSPQEIRLRFAVPRKALSHVDAARFTQIDYDREMALVLTEPGIPGKTELFGVVRIFSDPNNERAEYAIVVRKALSGHGLGSLLMNRIIEYARSRGTREIFGYVLAENTGMLDICRRLGFVQTPVHQDAGTVYVSLRLDGE
jgi:acetyltransferase